MNHKLAIEELTKCSDAAKARAETLRSIGLKTSAEKAETEARQLAASTNLLAMWAKAAAQLDAPLYGVIPSHDGSVQIHRIVEASRIAEAEREEPTPCWVSLLVLTVALLVGIGLGTVVWHFTH